MEEPSPQNWRRFTRLRPSKKGLQKGAKRIEKVTLKHAHTFIVRRWTNIKSVRRFALAWLVLVGLLIGVSGLQMLSYQNAMTVVSAAEGGTYAEGVMGPLETINPLFATTSAEKSASRLVYSGLLSYDDTNHLKGELASNWRVEQEGRRYIVDMKQTATWHDGASVTADDVVFTIERIKHPLTRATPALRNFWNSVIVKKVSEYSISFDLPAAYAPFPHALTFGVLPKHLLSELEPEALRESAFNRAPVGTGPFVFNRLQIIDPEQNRLVLYLTANESHISGTPKLDRYQLHVFQDSERIKNAFLTAEINAAADLTSNDLQAIRQTDPKAKIVDAKVYNGVYAIMRTDSPTLKDVKVRQALRLAADRQAIVNKLHGFGRVIDGPLLVEQVPSLADNLQPGHDLAAAKQMMDEAGWKSQAGKRTKDGQELKLTVAAPRSGDYPAIMESIVANWRELGVTVDTQLVEPETIQQNVLRPRAYDVLIYELSLSADPDVYPYWHSSQAGVMGLNLANYKSLIVDEALASAQARPEKNLRHPKYETFVENWLQDVPAIALYQPSLRYVTTESAVTLPPGTSVVDNEGRYRDVEMWTVEKGRTNKTP